MEEQRADLVSQQLSSPLSQGKLREPTPLTVPVHHMGQWPCPVAHQHILAHGRLPEHRKYLQALLGCYLHTGGVRLCHRTVSEVSASVPCLLSPAGQVGLPSSHWTLQDPISNVVMGATWHRKMGRCASRTCQDPAKQGVHSCAVGLLSDPRWTPPRSLGDAFTCTRLCSCSRVA